MPDSRVPSGTPDLSEWSPAHRQSLSWRLPGVAEGPEPAARGHLADAWAFLAAQLGEFEALASAIPAGREGFRYASGKWSVREVVGHLADAERILSMRALAAARGDATDLPGFDEDAYVATAGHDAAPFSRLIQELVAVRRSSLALFSGMREEDWTRRGSVKGHAVSARAWAFILGGHAELHLATLRNKYLI